MRKRSQQQFAGELLARAAASLVGAEAGGGGLEAVVVAVILTGVQGHTPIYGRDRRGSSRVPVQLKLPGTKTVCNTLVQPL